MTEAFSDFRLLLSSLALQKMYQKLKENGMVLTSLRENLNDSK